MDSLIKADFPSLETITFYLNTIIKMEQFYRFHSKKLRTYEFDCPKHHTIPFEDYRFLFKMENPVPLKIRVTNRTRINIKQRPYFDTLTKTGAKIIFYDKYRSNLRLRIWWLCKDLIFLSFFPLINLSIFPLNCFCLKLETIK